MSNSGAVILDRPPRPLVIRCGYEGSQRRINFPLATTCRLDSLRSRVEECFNLSAAPFLLSYTDDDGEEFSIRCEADLTEAISYFTSGDDDQAYSSYSGNSGQQFAKLGSAQKISIRLDVVVEYDGPSLSDTSSILSFQTGSGSGSGGGTSGYAESESDGSWARSRQSGTASRRSQLGQEEFIVDGVEAGDSTPGPTNDRNVGASMLEFVDGRLARMDLENANDGGHGDGLKSRRSARNSTSSQDTYQPPELHQKDDEGHLRWDEYGGDPGPSLLIHSELGSRWLREQSRLVRRPIAGGSGRNSRARYDDLDDGSDSDREGSIGNISLVRDARGKYYYSYEGSDSMSESSRLDLNASRTSLQSRRATKPPEAAAPVGPSGNAPVPVEPLLAPDCSACGCRLSYMRYVCQTCGERDMWTAGHSGKPHFTPLDASSEGDKSEDSGDSGWERRIGESEGTVYGAPHAGSQKWSTHASQASLLNGADVDGRVSNVANADELRARAGPRGYELCPSCIETHGVAHSKAAAREARRELTPNELRRKRRAGELRHAFREIIWGSTGWQDVEYSEGLSCTICKSYMLRDRFKCVSCAQFNLCRTCHTKVEEIHPAHVFLSLPDPISAPSGSRQNDYGDRSSSLAPRPLRHPGAFCHNCLQDIVGPRFHCAVCPSWDLCIQCEGNTAPLSNTAGHSADHIMMKIPVPLASSEVEAVSRRARDRWYQQDITSIASDQARAQLSQRSPSPTNETVYAGRSTQGPRTSVSQVNAMSGDDLDHQSRCSNCNEWIMGRRYQCANCPSEPSAYNLCSICELRSHRVHDPRHVFFKFDRPVDITLSSPRPLLPILYRGRVGEVPVGTALDPRDSAGYLIHVLHRETLCDIHSDQIKGVWLRCAHCAAGFDICLEAERIADHDPTHVFIVFKARVDMAAFRALADLASETPKPLLSRRVYNA